MFKKLIVLLMFAGIYAVATAHSDDCDDYYLHIKNNSSKTWTIVNTQYTHSTYRNSQIPSNGFEPGSVGYIGASADSSLHGVQMAITLTDGSHTLVLYGKQNECFLKAGKISTSSNPSDEVHFDNQEGSLSDKKAGHSYASIQY